MSKVSIIIPVFNQWKFTKQCIQSIQAFTHPTQAEIIVVDNGSQDGTAEYLKEFPFIKTITFYSNLGFVEACNAGAKAASGEVLCFLNNDTILTADWLEPLLKEIKLGAGIVGPKLTFPLSYDINSGGYAYFKKLKAFAPLFYNLDAGHQAVLKRRKIRAVLGACILITKDVFNAVNQFTDIGLEDVDLCLKVEKLGKEIVWTPASEVFHYGSMTISSHRSDELPDRSSSSFFERWPTANFIDEYSEILNEEGFTGDVTEDGRFSYVHVTEPGFVVSQNALAMCKQGQVQDAIVTLEEVIRKFPFHKQSHEILATLYTTQHRFVEAAGLWRNVITHRPKCFVAYVECLRVEHAQGKADRSTSIIDTLNKFPYIPFDVIESLNAIIK